MRSFSPRLRRAALLACIPLTFTLACNDSSTNPTTSDISGTYSLQSVGGATLPVTVQSGTTTVTLTSDVLTVGSDGTWSETESVQQVANGQTTTSTLDDGGTWTLSGTNVSFYSQSSQVTAYSGAYNSNTLTLDNGDGQAQVFRR